MKNILVPTDFSDNANKALDAAIALAKRFDAQLHLVHTYNTSTPAGHMSNANRVIKEDREREMEQYIEQIKSTTPSKVVIDGKCREGYPIEEIEREVDRVSADLLVMGTQGASNIAKKIWGSTASKLVSINKLPILAIPSETHYKDIKNMVLAVDALDLAILNTLNPALKLVQKSKFTLELLHVAKTDENSDMDESISKYLNNMDIPFSYNKVISNDVSEGILDFAHQKKGNILCLVAHKRGWFENLFHSSVSQRVALESDLPVLIVPDKKA